MRLKWFKQWGWWYLPASIPAAIIFVAVLAICAEAFLAVDDKSHSVSDTFYGVFPFFTCAFLLWDWIGARTSDY
jgi:hypothetical protein